MKRLSVNLALAAASVVISLLVCDRALGLLGLPAEVPSRIAHPANHEEVRSTIEFQYVFRTNRQGLRYRDTPLKKPAGTRRVFVAGDSFTEGEGVQEDERFTDRLETMFRNVSFINGGLSGTGPSTYGRLFLDVGMKYDPDALLICLFVNDVANTETGSLDPPGDRPVRSGLREIAHALLPHVYTRLKLYQSQREYLRRTRTSDFVATISEEARSRGLPESRIERWRNALPRNLVDAVNQGRFNGSILSYGLLYPEYWSDSIDITGARANAEWKDMASILTDLTARARKGGVEVALVLIPAPCQYAASQFSETNPWIVSGSEMRSEWLVEETEIQRRMKAWTSEEAIPFLDLTPVFRDAARSDASLIWELDGHWNERGHRVAADAIASWLRDGEVFSFIGGHGDHPRSAGTAQ